MKRILATILLFLIPISCFATVTTIEDFNALNSAKLDGQNSWADATDVLSGTTGQYVVTTSQGGVSPEEGAKFVYANSATAEGVKKSVTSVTTGHFGFWIYGSSSGQVDGNRDALWLITGTTQVGAARLQYVAASSNFTLFLVGATSQSITGVTTNTWHNVDIKFDAGAGTLKMRIDGGAYTSTVNGVNSFSNVNNVELVHDPNGAAQFSFDKIYYDDEQAAVTPVIKVPAIINWLGFW